MGKVEVGFLCPSTCICPDIETVSADMSRISSLGSRQGYMYVRREKKILCTMVVGAYMI